MRRRVFKNIEFLDYITANNSCVDTGIKATNNTCVEIMFKGISTSDDNGGNALFGVWNRNTNFCITRFENKWYFGSGSSEKNISMPVTFLTTQTIKYNYNKGLYINNTLKSSLNNFISTSDNIFLFARNLTYADQPAYCNVRLYSFKIWNSSDLIMNLIPAKLDNKLCLYDTVSLTCFYDKYDNIS